VKLDWYSFETWLRIHRWHLLFAGETPATAPVVRDLIAVPALSVGLDESVGLNNTLTTSSDECSH